MSFEIIYEHRKEDIYTRSSLQQCLEYRTPHMHRELEIVLYHGGETVAYVDSVRYQLKTGDVFLTFPNQIHSYETLAPENYRLFLVKPDLVPELATAFEMLIPVSAVIPMAANEPRIRVLSDALAELCSAKGENHPYRGPMIRGYLTALLSELVSRMEVNQVPRTDSDALRSIVSFCSKNYAQDLSLTALEENLHLNKYYISHLFSSKLGLRFNDYVNSLRISEACRLLLNSDESITAICDRVGFNTLRTFNRAFMKQMNVSPSDYRKNGQFKEGASAKGSAPKIGVTDSFYCGGDDCCF